MGRAGAQTIETQAVLIISAVVVVIFSSGVKLAGYQLPVIPVFTGIPVHSTYRILHLDGVVLIPGHGNHLAKALSGLVNGVGEDFKHGMLAALQPV